MSEIHEELYEKEESATNSPCLYHAGMKRETLNAKVFCTESQLHQLIERGVIDEPEIIVMKTIYTYRCVTRHTLTLAIKEDATVSSEYKRSNYKKMLAKLVKSGLVKRHTLVYDDNGEEVRTPCFYTLSHVAYLYVNRVYMKGMGASRTAMPYPAKMNIQEMLCYVIFLQFHASFMKLCGKDILHSYTHYNIRARAKSYSIFGLYQFKSKLDEKSKIDIIVIPVRTDEKSIQTLNHAFYCIEDAAKRESSPFKLPMYLLLCESTSHAISIDKWIRKSEYKSLPYLFLNDHSLMGGDLFGKMFSVEQTDSGELTLQLKHFNL